MANWSARNLLIASILLAAIVGGITGLGASYLSHPSPSPQTRDIYLFAQDLSFSVPSNLSSDYIYSSSQITVNKGRYRDSSFLQPH